jgi:hypothetical protein
MLKLLSYLGDSLSGAREFIKVHAYAMKGTRCPCCGNYVKSYKRKFTHDMARFMVLLVWTFERTGNWVDITTFNFRGGDYAKVLFWKLAEHKPNTDDPEKKESGMWRPTELGIKFAHKLESVPTYAHLNWNGEFEGNSGPQLFIDKALQNKFNYTDLVEEMMKY